MITPVLAEIADEYAGRLTIVQLDVDANPVTPAAHAVLSVPTLLLLHAGEPVKSLVGARSTYRLRRDLGDCL